MKVNRLRRLNRSNKRYGESAHSIKSVFEQFENFEVHHMSTSNTPELINKIHDVVVGNGRVKVHGFAAFVHSWPKMRTCRLSKDGWRLFQWIPQDPECG